MVGQNYLRIEVIKIDALKFFNNFKGAKPVSTMPLSPIKVFIVEDQPNILNEINLLVESYVGFTVVGSCGTVKSARQLILQIMPDLLLLDINLPDGTGFDVLKDIPELKVIFITAFEKHAIQAIKWGALDYLVKPVNEEEFALALNKASQFIPAKYEQVNIARQYHEHGLRTRLVLRSLDYLQIVEIDQIIYCQSNSGYTTFHLNDNRKIVVSKILKEYEDILTEPSFIRPHQSYLVNSDFIDKYSKDGFIHLKSGESIPVATRRKEAVLEFFNKL